MLWATPLFLCLVLVAIGIKIVVGDWLFGGKVPAALSLGITTGILAGGILYSLWNTRAQTA
ncbi:MAG: hypothetical protein KJS95_04160 [Gammaproteobacteria bacterium]|nr:hypothetical protein [Gammaproteobacteria bacterium]